jgi:hypothetical protein
LGLGSSIYFNSIFTHPNNISLLDATYLASINGTSSYVAILKWLPITTLFFIFSIIPFNFYFNKKDDDKGISHINNTDIDS